MPRRLRAIPIKPPEMCVVHTMKKSPGAGIAHGASYSKVSNNGLPIESGGDPQAVV